jgi:predicted exporter
MTVLRRRRLLAAAILGCAAILGALWLLRVDFTRKISTDVLDLLPSGDRSPEMAMVRSLAGDAEARVMLFALAGPSGRPAPEGAASRFAAELARQPEFEQALSPDDPAPRDALGRELFERRFTLLFPIWLRERTAAHDSGADRGAPLSEWLATDAASRLDAFLAAPAALAFQDEVPSDPLLLMPGAVDRMKAGLALVAPPATASGGPPARVWARIAASPMSEAGQEPVFAAVDRALAATRAVYPGVDVSFTGVNRFAAASKARIQREFSWLNLLSAAAVAAVACLSVRGAHRALHLAPPVLFAVLGAWVFTTMAFERAHILVFVIGSLLTGVAVDYGIYLYMQPPAFPGEDCAAKVRRLRKPLLSSCFTAVAGFSLLLFSDLPPVRQLGLFVASGLLCALGGSVLYFSALGNAWLEPRRFPARLAPAAGVRRGVRRALVAVWLAALPGLFMVAWRDDIRDLQIPSPRLQREDARVRALFDGPSDQAVYLTRGRTLGEARAALDRFQSWLKAEDPGADFANLGAVIPTEAAHAAALRFVREHPEFPARLRAALESAGFEAGAFAPFFEAYASFAARASGDDLGAAVGSLRSRLSGPLSLLVHDDGNLAWYVTLASRAARGAPPADTRTVSAGQLQSLNAIFARCRRSALWLSLTGLAIVGGGVLLSYGPRDGIRIFSIPCGVCLGLFGVFGWLGLPLNLFNLLGAFLGVCLAHNYSIFSVTSAYRREPPPASVRLSALCASASFGVLALSGIPAVRALGGTVALMVLAALLTIEFEHFAPISRRTP